MKCVHKLHSNRFRNYVERRVQTLARSLVHQHSQFTNGKKGGGGRGGREKSEEIWLQLRILQDLIALIALAANFDHYTNVK